MWYRNFESPTATTASTTTMTTSSTTTMTRMTSTRRAPEQAQENSSSVFLQSFREKRNDVDCGSKICFLSHVMLENCFVFVHNNHTDCEIPCKLENCDKELHHFIACPVWKCHDIQTTTTRPTTTTTFTTSTKSTMTTATTPSLPTPITLSPLPPLDHPGYLYGSFALNILLFLILSGLLIAKCKKCIIRRFRNRRQRSQSQPLASDVERPANAANPGNPIVRPRDTNQRRRPYFGFDTSSSEDLNTRSNDENVPLLPSYLPRLNTATTTFMPASRATQRQSSSSNSRLLVSPVLPARFQSRDSPPPFSSFNSRRQSPTALSTLSSHDNFQTRLAMTRPNPPPRTFNPNPRLSRRPSI